jgi:hypothetical protein
MIENVAFTPRALVACLICGSRVAGVEIDTHALRFGLCWPCCQFIGRVTAKEAVDARNAQFIARVMAKEAVDARNARKDKR